MARQFLCSVLVTIPLALSLPGCSGTQMAPTPLPLPAGQKLQLPNTSKPQDPTPQFWTISGTVWLYGETGVVPASEGPVFAWVEHAQGGYGAGAQISETGRYELQVAKDTTWVSVSAGAGVQPCAIGFSPKGDSTVDINLVWDLQQLGANLPPGLPLQPPTLSGVVYEQTSKGRRPIAEALVGLDAVGGDGVVIANTRTDANGRYMLCGVPQRERTALYVQSGGFSRLFQFEDFRGKSTLDVDMTR
jgi:hypothetical protein